MKTNKNTWEDKLRKELGDDSSRFPLPENYFSSLKEKIEASAFAEKAMADRKVEAELPEPLTRNPKPLLKWVYLAALPIAAALAFFILNRETVPTQEPINQELMSEAAEGFYESRVEEAENLEIDSQAIVALASNESTKSMQEEVLYEEYEYDILEEESDEVDPLDDLDLEDIEEYLVENININSEL